MPYYIRQSGFGLVQGPHPESGPNRALSGFGLCPEIKPAFILSDDFLIEHFVDAVLCRRVCSFSRRGLDSRYHLAPPQADSCGITENIIRDSFELFSFIFGLRFRW